MHKALAQSSGNAAKSVMADIVVGPADRRRSSALSALRLSPPKFGDEPCLDMAKRQSTGPGQMITDPEKGCPAT
jgi:hypothetical protein